MEHRLCIKKDRTNSEFPNLRALIGALLFIAHCSRPDVLFAVNYISRFQNFANVQIFRYALRVLSYLVAAYDLVLPYHSPDIKNPVVTFVDAAFADVCDEEF